MTEYPRDRRLFKVALAAVRDYEAELSGRVLRDLAGAPGLQLIGPVEPEARVPTFAFRLEGMEDEEVERSLWERGSLQVAAGNHYSGAVLRGLGRSSVVRASFAHYNSPAEAEALTAFLRDLGAR